jgi:dipeptidyl aminopeptidase/acylaminoacyl peptidase
MAKTYTEELVYTHSEDGVLLAGALTRPAPGPAKPIAIIYIHGRPISAFYPVVIGHAREMSSHGYAVLAANTRGHDIGTWLFRQDAQPMLGGAWWEKFEECPTDLEAWVTFTVGLGFRGVVLLGHSFGALKVVYSQAQRDDPRVVGLICMSGSLRAARAMRPERVALAERMLSEGRGLDLLPWEEYGSPYGTMSAQAYLSRARANLDVFGLDTPNAAISRVRCPLFLCYGTREEDVGTAADLEMIRRNAVSAGSIHTQMFEGAEHGFVGHEREVAVAIADWIDGLPSAG